MVAWSDAFISPLSALFRAFGIINYHNQKLFHQEIPFARRQLVNLLCNLPASCRALFLFGCGSWSIIIYQPFFYPEPVIPSVDRPSG